MKYGHAVLGESPELYQEAAEWGREQKKEIYSILAKEQLDAWNTGSGYFYWNYKLLTDTINTPGWVGWDFERCVDFEWLSLGN